MGYRLQSILVRLRQLAIAVLLLLSVSGWMSGWSFPVYAAIRQVEQVPGTIVYQSQQTLQDGEGQSWQAIVFKRMRGSMAPVIQLNLIGLPDQIEVDHTQSLTLTTAAGDSFVTPDLSGTLMTDTPVQSHVGQYDLQAIVPFLPPDVSLQLTVPVIGNKTVHVIVPSKVIEEWQTIAACEMLVCERL